MSYLFDTDAVSEVLRSRPLPGYVRWLATVPRADQFTSAVVIGELYKGAFRSPNRDFHVENIETRILPALTILPYDTSTARVYGEIEAALAKKKTITCRCRSTNCGHRDRSRSRIGYGKS